MGDLSNPFMLDESEYGRDVDIFRHYKEDAAFYLSRRSGKPYDQCLAFVEKQVGKGGKFEVRDPAALFLIKEKKGCRTKAAMPFTQYLKTAQENEWILSPTLATYLNPHQKKSLLASYISGNIGKRKVAKKEKFQAQVAGDTALKELKDVTQSSFKIKNNSLSGAHASPYTILFNKSSHSTLTSTCRSATGYGNANNEKMLSGNRHYWSPEIVRANIVSICRYTDLSLVQQAMDQFGIVPPTVDQCMECVEYSTRFYWQDPHQMKTILSLIEGLSEVERSAFVYVGDLYHLAKYNDGVVRKFLDQMSTPVETTDHIDDPDAIIGSLDDDTEALVKYLCIDEIKKRSMDDVRKEDPEAWKIVAATAKHIIDTVDSYKLLIHALWSTKNVPASVASLPSIVRRGAVASDTDSTIFTVQHWTEWFTGSLGFDKKSCAIRDVMAYISSRSIMHILKLMTAQLGVVKEDQHLLAMKNEFTFPVFALTNRSKHYFAFISAQEGNVFKEYDLERKGVALRNSNSPKHIRDGSEELIRKTMGSVIKGEKFSMVDTLKEVAAVEQEIYDSTMSGKYDYFRSAQIKPKDSYKNPDSSPFLHYLMWEEVFADKYGHAEEPPYAAVKVSVDADNPTKLKLWLDRMEDQAIAEKLRDWLKRHKKPYMTTMMLPEPVLKVTGVPKEIVAGVNVRKLISDTMEPYYLVLESVGFYIKDASNSKLISDIV